MNNSPNRLLLEKVITAQLLLRGEGLSSHLSKINLDSFYTSTARDVVAAIHALVKKNVQVDLISVCNQNQKLKASELTEIINEALDKLSATQLKIDTLPGRLRQLEELNLIDSAASGEGLDKIQHKLNLLNSQGIDKHLSAEEIIKRGEELKEIIKNKKANFNYPFKLFNEHTRGIQHGQLVVVAGRPSIGKSALAQNIALHVARLGGKVLFASGEMDVDSLILRFTSQLENINLFYEPDDISRVNFATSWNKLDLRLYQFSSTGELMSKIMEDSELDLVVVDYIQSLSPKTSRFTGMTEKVGYIVSDLIDIKNKYNIPILALSQYNRVAANQQPDLADLYQSGKIEQAADVVFSLWSKKSDSKIGDKKKIYVDLLKNRNGRTFSNSERAIKEYSLLFEGKTFNFLDGDTLGQSKEDKEYIAQTESIFNEVLK